MAYTVRQIDSAKDWDAYALAFSAHPLQTSSWAALKESTGEWSPCYLAVSDNGTDVGGACVLVRSLPFPFKEIAYVPRGPFASEDSDVGNVADAVAAWCMDNTSAVCLRIEPELLELELSEGWRKADYVLLNRTAVIELTAEEDELMAGIPSRKARQYIRKAERDGVVVRPATHEDLPRILELYHATAKADGFPLHIDEYYIKAMDALEAIQQVFVAEREGEIEAFLWNVLTPSGTCFELWGAVNDSGKRSRANYFLKWQAICAAKEAGAFLYDMNGLLNDGISDFKLLFSKDERLWVGTFDKPLTGLYGAMNVAMDVRDKLVSIKNRLMG